MSHNSTQYGSYVVEQNFYASIGSHGSHAYFELPSQQPVLDYSNNGCWTNSSYYDPYAPQQFLDYLSNGGWVDPSYCPYDLDPLYRNFTEHEYYDGQVQQQEIYDFPLSYQRQFAPTPYFHDPIVQNNVEYTMVEP